MDRALRYLSVLLLAFGAVTVLSLLSEDAEASHVRGGTLGWAVEPLPTYVNGAVDIGPPPQADIDAGTGWFEFKGRLALHSGTLGPTAVGTIVPLSQVWGGYIDAGDGTLIHPHIRIDLVDLDSERIEGTLVDPLGNDGVPHEYPAPNDAGQPWLASYTSCCRIGTTPIQEHINNPPWGAPSWMRLETTVDMTKTLSSPRMTAPLLHKCPIVELCTVVMPTLPFQEPVFPCRFSTGAEAGGQFTQPGPPHAPDPAVVLPTGTAVTGCIVTWDATGATMSTNSDRTVYSMQVQMGPTYARSSAEVLIELDCSPLEDLPPVLKVDLCKRVEEVCINRPDEVCVRP